MFLKKLILIKQANRKSEIIVTIWYFLNKRSKFQLYICNRCHDLLIMSMNLRNIAILKIKMLIIIIILLELAKMKL